jgi:hypothetical protein
MLGAKAVLNIIMADPLIVVAPIVGLLCFALIVCITDPKHIDDVRLVIGLWSFAFTFMMLFLYIVTHLGFMKGDKFTGPYAAELNWFLAFLFDLETDVAIPVVFFCLFAAPKVFGYLILAPFGYAATTNTFGIASKFLFWSMIKSVPLVFGFLSGYIVYGYANTPVISPETSKSMFRILGLAVPLSLVFTMWFLMWYRILTSTPDPCTKADEKPKLIRQLIQRVHARCARNVQNKTSLLGLWKNQLGRGRKK